MADNERLPKVLPPTAQPQVVYDATDVNAAIVNMNARIISLETQLSQLKKEALQWTSRR